MYKAVQYSNYTQNMDDIVINDMSKPVATPNTVIIKIAYASTNPVDVLLMNGIMRGFGIEVNLPSTLGIEVSGYIDGIGENVTSFSIGDRVQAFNWGDHGPMSPNIITTCGGYAEYIHIHVSKVVKVPEHVDMQIAAGMPCVSLTAYQVLTGPLQVHHETRILILGGSSTVGAIAIQIAKFLGATVYTTCSTRAIEYVQQFQPDHIINYTVEKWDDPDLVKDIDCIFDCVGEKNAYHRCHKIVKPDTSAFITIANPTFQMSDDEDIDLISTLRHASYFVVSQNNDHQAALLSYINEGKLRIPVEDIFHFTHDGIKQALTKTMAGKSLGKNLIRVDEHH